MGENPPEEELEQGIPTQGPHLDTDKHVNAVSDEMQLKYEVRAAEPQGETWWSRMAAGKLPGEGMWQGTSMCCGRMQKNGGGSRAKKCKLLENTSRTSRKYTFLLGGILEYSPPLGNCFIVRYTTSFLIKHDAFFRHFHHKTNKKTVSLKKQQKFHIKRKWGANLHNSTVDMPSRRHLSSLIM